MRSDHSTYVFGNLSNLRVGNNEGKEIGLLTLIFVISIISPQILPLSAQRLIGTRVFWGAGMIMNDFGAHWSFLNTNQVFPLLRMPESIEGSYDGNCA